MPLGYDPWDWRNLIQNAAVTTLPVDPAGGAPSFTTAVPSAPDVPVRRVPTTSVAGQVQVPEDNASLSTPDNPLIRPPVLTRFPGSETLSPLGRPAQVKPPIIPDPLPQENARDFGPMGSTPLATGAPTAMGVAPPMVVGEPRPVMPTFGNPEQDKAVTRIRTGVATPAGQPTLAKPETDMEKFRKAIEHKDFTGAAKALADAFKKKPAPQPFKMEGSRSSGGSVKDLTGSGQALLATIMKERKGNALVAGDLGRKQKKARTDDPHEYEQERFDFRRRQGRR